MDELYEALMQPDGQIPDLLKRPAWHEQVACRGQGTDLWFPGLSTDQRKPAAAVGGEHLRSVSGAPGVWPRWRRRESWGVWAGASTFDRKQRHTRAA